VIGEPLPSDPNPSLENTVAQLPAAPGVYLFKNSGGTVLYVGKAKSLRSRVRSYFQHLPSPQEKLQALVSQIAVIDHIVTTSEKEALLLEGTLIKRHRPRYNVILKDDKNYPYLRLSLEEEFPRLSLVRRVKKDASLYFGPFASAPALRETMKVIHQHFLLRKCQSKQFQFRRRPCLNYQMGQCPAPCCRLIDGEKYRAVVREVELFLKGKNRELVKLLEERMTGAAEELNFEKAARIRDRLASLKETLEKQKAVMLDFTDRDVIGLHRENGAVTIAALFMRGGYMTGSAHFTLHAIEAADEEVVASFVNQFYREGRLIPDELLIPCALEDQTIIAESLRDRKGGRVEMLAPRKGEKARLIAMAALNAESAYKTSLRREGDAQATAEQLRQALHLHLRPDVIECYDISHLGGRQTVGSMVQFNLGEPVKNHYRRFKIKSDSEADDCASIYEVLSRRFAPGEKLLPPPDLIVVDGGKGQLNAAVTVAGDAGITKSSIIALAKGRAQRHKAAREGYTVPEQIFIPNRKNPVILPRGSAGLLLLQRIRDEAHRFAITYQKTVRSRTIMHSPLEDIPGVGKTTCKRLIRHFGSMDRMKEASLDAIIRVPFLKQKVAEDIYRFLHAQGQIA
jgi:excinuclease ABC subunit C